MCQSGLKQLQDVDEKLFDNLATFSSDIFNEKSLEFYRGRETAEAVVEVNDKLNLIIKLLAPHLMEQGAHKVIEFLIRLFEIHIHCKTAVLNAFLPYFETVFFLRMMQCLALEKDEFYYFLGPFAREGTSIDKKTLVRAFSRNGAMIFTKYSEFAFSLLDN
jgi:U3 small nucleolar RNA-associated protein 10